MVSKTSLHKVTVLSVDYFGSYILFCNIRDQNLILNLCIGMLCSNQNQWKCIHIILNIQFIPLHLQSTKYIVDKGSDLLSGHMSLLLLQNKTCLLPILGYSISNAKYYCNNKHTSWIADWIIILSSYMFCKTTTFLSFPFVFPFV